MARQGVDEQATPAIPDAAVTSRPQVAADSLRGVFGTSVVLGALGVGAGLGLAAMLTLQAPTAVEPALANLLHAMVGIKALILAGASALVAMRLRGPVATASLAGYAVGLGLSAGALVWLWGLSGLLAGSALFYGGLILTYLTAGRDGRLGGLLRILPPARAGR